MERREDKSIVVEGRTVEEALQAACDMLETTPNQVDYEVSESNRNGMLGFLRGKVFKVRVWEKSPAERMLREMIEGLFARLGFQVTFKITRAEDAYEIDLETDGSDGLLIGRGGETLTSLQHLISRMAGHRDEDLRVRVDVAGYRRRRHELLRRKARDLAERALARGRDVMTEPLPADERRVVHLALAEDSRVQTRAIGEGAIKRIAVVPQSGARASTARSSAGRASTRQGSRDTERDERDTRERQPGRPVHGRMGSRSDHERGESRHERRSGSWRRPSQSETERSQGRREPRQDRYASAHGEKPEEPLEDMLVGRRDAALQDETSARTAGDDDRATRGEQQSSAGRDETAPAHDEPDNAAKEGWQAGEAHTDEAHAEGRGARSRIFQLPDDSESYFRMPSTPQSEEGSTEPETKSGEQGPGEKPMTYGRRPQSGKRRRR